MAATNLLGLVPVVGRRRQIVFGGLMLAGALAFGVSDLIPNEPSFYRKLFSGTFALLATWYAVELWRDATIHGEIAGLVAPTRRRVLVALGFMIITVVTAILTLRPWG